MKYTFAPSADLVFGTCARTADDASPVVKTATASNAEVFICGTPPVGSRRILLLLLRRHRRGRGLDPLVLAIVRRRLVLRLAELLGVFFRGVVGLCLGLRRFRLRFVGRRRQLRPHRTGRHCHRGAHDQDPNVHSATPIQCCACGAIGTPDAVPALIFPDLMSLYQYSWCSFAQASSTYP